MTLKSNHLKSLAIIALLGLLSLSSPALPIVPDDRLMTTTKVAVSWEQNPAEPIVTAYKVYFWKSGDDPTKATVIDVPSPPQVVGTVTHCRIIHDGFVPGVTYQMQVTATNGMEESFPTEIITFRIPQTIPTPKSLKVVPSAGTGLVP